jgi:hypothetical protein
MWEVKSVDCAARGDGADAVEQLQGAKPRELVGGMVDAGPGLSSPMHVGEPWQRMRGETPHSPSPTHWRGHCRWPSP